MRCSKRLFDFVAAGLGIGLLLPLMALLALLVLAVDGPPVLYREQRLGRGGRLFTLYKFRTLRPGTGTINSVAPEDDPRITRIGLWLRRWRLDEFPQLVNVLRGDMSLVGPRPMPPTHAVALARDQLDSLLSVRPGITDPAALYFLAEDAVLAGQAGAETAYLERFQPAKVHMQIDSFATREFLRRPCRPCAYPGAVVVPLRPGGIGPGHAPPVVTFPRWGSPADSALCYVPGLSPTRSRS